MYSFDPNLLEMDFLRERKFCKVLQDKEPLLGGSLHWEKNIPHVGIIFLRHDLDKDLSVPLSIFPGLTLALLGSVLVYHI